MTEEELTCSNCGGEFEVEIIGDFRDWICKECGVVNGGELIAEDQQSDTVDEEYEVME